MKRISPLTLLLTLICSAAQAQKPNIVFILTDDLGYGDVSFLNSKSKVHTPHMDSLAKAGVYYTDAHSPSAICSPSRYSILTGRYAWRNPRLLKGIVPPWGPSTISNTESTLPRVLAKAGYDTACIGKWHLGYEWPFAKGYNANNTRKGGNSVAKPAMFNFTKPIQGGPLGAGFKYYFGVDCPNFPPYCFIENGKLVGKITQISAKSLTSEGERGHIHGDGPGAADYNFEKIMPTLTEKAVEYVDQASKKDQPFFLFFTTTSPHTPVVPTKDFKGKSKAALYGDYVAQTDDSIGQVIAALKKSGVYENTLIIVSSDNGPSPQIQNLIRTHKHYPAGELRGMKFDSWEGGHRVPFIASWPKGGITGGKKIADPIILTDLYATLAGISGEQLDDTRDSVNFLTSLRGKGPTRSEMVYHNGLGQIGIRQGDWVLLLQKASGFGEPAWRMKIQGIKSPDTQVQLFKLKQDIRQRNNLAAKNPDKVKELKDRLQQIRMAK